MRVPKCVLDGFGAEPCLLGTGRALVVDHLREDLDAPFLNQLFPRRGVAPRVQEIQAHRLAEQLLLQAVELGSTRREPELRGQPAGARR